MAYNKGDLVLPINRVKKKDWLKGLYHPAVIWEDKVREGSDFLGVMITHTEPSKRFDNILMEKGHFENGHEVEFSNSHFVNQLFVKFQSWGEFEKVGRLTTDGIAFIRSNLTNTEPTTFDKYK